MREAAAQRFGCLCSGTMFKEEAEGEIQGGDAEG
jgi:hypothetical protein